jgi:DTW domain-containing protein YfiP
MGRRQKPHLRCDDCRLHRSLCICALIPRVVTRTHVVLLVHQLEANKTTSTGVLAGRCLANSQVAHRGREPLQREGAAADPSRAAAEPPSPYALIAAASVGRRPLLLFPQEDAIPIDRLEPGPLPVLLVVPDGTWRQAARARSHLIRRLGIPCVKLSATEAPGEHRRLRVASRGDRFATVEALAAALRALEGPEAGPAVEAALIRIYRVMCDRTLWSNGRITREAVTGGIPEGVRSHDPLGGST